MNKIAIIVGGADQTMDEYHRFTSLFPTFERATFVINDMIAAFPDYIDHAVTLHPDKLKKWAHDRNAAKLVVPGQVWAHRPHPLVSSHTSDWGGSSGLFAFKIARELEFKKIVFCGVPMDAQSNHFVRHTRWNASAAFRRGWNIRLNIIKPYARSFSGWTMQQLGAPTLEWLAGE